ncbi:MAG TPA: hypothetical protein VIR58_06480 [Acidimicrobiales bacterium]
MAEPPPEPPPEPASATWLPLDEHTPRTAAEAGIELAPKSRRRWVLVGASAVAVLVAAAVFVAWRSGSGTDSVLEVDLGECVSPVVTDVDAPVDVVDCEPGSARVVQRERHPGTAVDLHPGDGALELYGQGVCQGRVEASALVVAVPSPTSWSAGERSIACLERL